MIEVGVESVLVQKSLNDLQIVELETVGRRNSRTSQHFLGRRRNVLFHTNFVVLTVELVASNRTRELAGHIVEQGFELFVGSVREETDQNLDTYE